VSKTKPSLKNFTNPRILKFLCLGFLKGRKLENLVFSTNFSKKSKMAGDNDPLKNQENDQIASNGNGHLAEPLDDTESDNENSGDENERSGYELLPQNDIPNQG